MENNKKILFKFGLYFLSLLLIIIIGISNVFADTYSASQFDANLYDNYGPSLYYVTTDYTNNRWQGTIPTMTANSSGAAWGISSPVVLLSGHTYSLSAQISGPFGGNIRLSTYNRIGVGTSFANAVTSYQNNTYVTENYSNVSYNILQFAFTPTTNGNYIVFAFATTYTGNNQTFWLENIIIDDLGAGGVSETTINNSLNNQTNILNNSITASTNDITANSNANRDAIINNQNANNDALIENDNANTDRIIEDNKKNFQTCRDSINLFDYDNSTFYTSLIEKITVDNEKGFKNKTALSANIMPTFTVPTLEDGKTYTISFNIWSNVNTNITNSLYINSNTSTTHNLTRITTTKQKLKGTFTYHSGSSYLHIYPTKQSNEQIIYITNIQIQEGSTATDFEPYGEEICSNKLDEQTNAINGLNDNINDDNTDGATSEASEFFSDFNTNTFGLTSIITAPLNLIQSLTSKTCTPLHLPLPYLNNKYLDLPCMSTIYSQHFGTFFTLYQTITYGIIAYWVCVRIFNHVKDFKNPEHDEIEVVDL